VRLTPLPKDDSKRVNSFEFDSSIHHTFDSRSLSNEQMQIFGVQNLNLRSLRPLGAGPEISQLLQREAVNLISPRPQGPGPEAQTLSIYYVLHVLRVSGLKSCAVQTQINTVVVDIDFKYFFKLST